MWVGGTGSDAVHGVSLGVVHFLEEENGTHDVVFALPLDELDVFFKVSKLDGVDARDLCALGVEEIKLRSDLDEEVGAVGFVC